MRILISMLCLTAPLVLAQSCGQNYVRVYHYFNPGDDLQAAYTDMTNIVNGQLNWACFASDNTPQYDALSSCWYTTTPPSTATQFVCGFRVWRTFQSCSQSSPTLANLVDQLNWAFFQSSFADSTYQWTVYDQQPSGNVNC
jgi:hypothetical protein